MVVNQHFAGVFFMSEAKLQNKTIKVPGNGVGAAAPAKGNCAQERLVADLMRQGVAERKARAVAAAMCAETARARGGEPAAATEPSRQAGLDDPKRKRSKYGSKRVDFDGFRFDSKREAAYYARLVLLQQSGDVRFFLRQVPFHLPGGVRYVVDFLVVWKDGRLEFVDVKGYPTALYKAKKRIVEAAYGVEITEK